NNADSLVYQTEKILREHGDKITGGEKDAVESGLKELKDAVAGDDIERIRQSTETLMGASQTFSQKLYEQAAAESYSDIKPPSDEDVVDAEIVDEDKSA
ncbi:MAG: Hsp70 family protein, partial [Actinobacteria bacterium]|nr:Hsp70 family protein [Actinomycetota bacterium]